MPTTCAWVGSRVFTVDESAMVSVSAEALEARAPASDAPSQAATVSDRKDPGAAPANFEIVVTMITSRKDDLPATPGPANVPLAPLVVRD
ncbi:hypothetical protein CHELA1G2_20350 [Hyphomicrobiales bacterium]|nr:hypothetical protein CHELA1G2_20350 [Hyphomicrobiales bacterium]